MKQVVSIKPARLNFISALLSLNPASPSALPLADASLRIASALRRSPVLALPEPYEFKHTPHPESLAHYDSMRYQGD